MAIGVCRAADITSLLLITFSAQEFTFQNTVQDGVLFVASHLSRHYGAVSSLASIYDV